LKFVKKINTLYSAEIGCKLRDALQSYTAVPLTGPRQSGITTFLREVFGKRSSHIRALPRQFVLNQNYPNPFNPSTTFTFTLPQRSDIRLTIYDQLGQVVAIAAQGAYSAGEHQIHWDAANLPGGVYYYRLQIGNEYQAKKMVLLK